LIKEQEREINKFYKKLGKQTLKVNKAIKTFEYQIDLRIYKQYLDKDDKKIKRHWQFETDSAGNQYVIFRKFTSYKMKPLDLSFLRYTIGRFYNIHDDYNIVDAFRNSFFNSDELNFNDYEQDAGLVDAHALAISQHLDTHAVSLAGRAIEDGEVRLVDGHGFLNDAAGFTLHGVGLDMFFHHVDAIHNQVAVVFAQRHLAALAFVTTGQNDDLVAFANLVHEQSSENFRGQGHDLHELLGAQLARHRAEDTGADRLQLCIEQHSCVAIEFNERTVATADAFGSTDHNSAIHLAFFDAATRSGFFDAHLDDVAHACIATLGTAEHLNAQNGLRTGVVSDI